MERKPHNNETTSNTNLQMVFDDICTQQWFKKEKNFMDFLLIKILDCKISSYSMLQVLNSQCLIG